MTVVVSSCPVCHSPVQANSVVCPNDGTELVSAESDPLLGTVVGSYRVLKRLGIGGMGAVYEGVETTIDKRVALKIVHPHVSNHPDLPSLISEAKAVNAIGDRGIVDITGFGTLPDGRQYLVMELLEGESLESLIARKRQLTLVEALEIAEPLLATLEAAHAAGFVHRDIKPGNVFIVRPPRGAPFPKLLDFGLAQRAMTANTVRLGTPSYIAPEQATGNAVGPAADLYAFGCLFFEALVGQVPFVGDDPRAVVQLHLNAKRPHLKEDRPDLPDAIDALVTALLQVRPEDRPTAKAAREVLLAAAPKPAGARLKLAVGGAVFALLAGLTLAWALKPAPPPPLVADDPLERAVASAVAGVAQSADAGLWLGADGGSGAVEQLLSARAAFPGRREWIALGGSLTQALQLEARRALAAGDLDQATRLLDAAAKLSQVDGGEAPLAAEVARSRFARGSGMVAVGELFVDAYEYPNRAGALPVTHVDWADAVALCEKAGKHLCTEAEWRTACAGPGNRPYPYGVTFDSLRCHGKARKAKGPLPSGSLPGCMTDEGAYDLSGNVAEWTATPLKEGAPQRVVRGGSWAQSDSRLACETRDYFMPGQGGAEHIGFRCCL